MDQVISTRAEDKKKYWWLLSVFFPMLTALCAIIVLLTTNPLWAMTPILFVYIVVPIIDLVIGKDSDNPTQDLTDQMDDDPYYRYLLLCALGVLYLGFAITVYVVGTTDLPIWAFVLLAISQGMVSGGLGLTMGHEMGHKLNRVDRFGAKLAISLTGYAHFPIEHNRGHHTDVATPEDVASARYGESVYKFAMREIPGAAKRGWTLEVQRLSKRNLKIWSLNNELLQGYLISLIITVVAVALFGWGILLFLIIHHAAGWFQLTLANYVEHYGLLRDRKPNGKYEPCEPRHSWNTNHLFSNLLLFHLQRHSDHHAYPMRPYQTLRNFDDIPHLPSGYPGCFVLAMIPPLWRRVMDPKVLNWAGGDIKKVNTGGVAN